MGDFILNTLKIFLALLLLPVVIATAFTFQDHLTTYPASYQDFLMWGLLSFFIIYLFVYQFWGIYEFGQKMVVGLFKFTAPFDRVISYIIPFYMTIVLLAFYVTHVFLKIDAYDHYFMFFAGFTAAMHIILSSQEMQEQEKNSLKPSYFLTMSFVFIFNVCVIVLLFDLILREFSFFSFFKRMAANAYDIYILIFERITAIKIKI